MDSHWTRKTAVAGSFYPRDRAELQTDLERYLNPSIQPGRHVFGILAPHAGYMYSGKFAGEIYRQIEVPDRVFILCPNHTGFGERISIWTQGEWQTPLGSVPIDQAVAEKLAAQLAIKPDREAHLYEHAIEVQLPFLQARNPKVRIIPIVLAHLTIEECHFLGEKLQKLLKEHPGLLVASSDMSHFLSSAEAERRDRFALESFTRMSADSLYQVVREKDISMCGYIPTTTVLAAAIEQGCKKAEILSYGNSADANEDYDRVVAYASGWIY